MDNLGDYSENKRIKDEKIFIGALMFRCENVEMNESNSDGKNFRT